MPVHGAVSLLMRGTVQFEMKAGVHQGSVFCSSSLCLKPCHMNYALGTLEGPLC